VSIQHSLTLSQGLPAPSHARAWTSARIPPPLRPIAEDALLVVSELVTNAVRHGEPEIVLSVDIGVDRIRIEVRDGNDVVPTVPAEDPAVDRPTGRGLLIVAATASDWGVVRTDEPGKCVWAEIRADRPAQDR
jgi:anti-sigma regulatory factor (Ser/Thr protein kinase)